MHPTHLPPPQPTEKQSCRPDLTASMELTTGAPGAPVEPRPRGIGKNQPAGPGAKYQTTEL